MGQCSSTLRPNRNNEADNDQNEASGQNNAQAGPSQSSEQSSVQQQDGVQTSSDRKRRTTTVENENKRHRADWGESEPGSAIDDEEGPPLAGPSSAPSAVPSVSSTPAAPSTPVVPESVQATGNNITEPRQVGDSQAESSSQAAGSSRDPPVLFGPGTNRPHFELPSPTNTPAPAEAGAPSGAPSGAAPSSENGTDTANSAETTSTPENSTRPPLNRERRQVGTLSHMLYLAGVYTAVNMMESRLTSAEMYAGSNGIAAERQRRQREIAARLRESMRAHQNDPTDENEETNEQSSENAGERVGEQAGEQANQQQEQQTDQQANERLSAQATEQAHNEQASTQNLPNLQAFLDQLRDGEFDDELSRLITDPDRFDNFFRMFRFPGDESGHTPVLLLGVRAVRLEDRAEDEALPPATDGNAAANTDTDINNTNNDTNTNANANTNDNANNNPNPDAHANAIASAHVLANAISNAIRNQAGINNVDIRDNNDNGTGDNERPENERNGDEPSSDFYENLRRTLRTRPIPLGQNRHFYPLGREPIRRFPIVPPGNRPEADQNQERRDQSFDSLVERALNGQRVELGQPSEGNTIPNTPSDLNQNRSPNGTSTNETPGEHVFDFGGRQFRILPPHVLHSEGDGQRNEENGERNEEDGQRDEENAQRDNFRNTASAFSDAAAQLLTNLFEAEHRRARFMEQVGATPAGNAPTAPPPFGQQRQPFGMPGTPPPPPPPMNEGGDNQANTGDGARAGEQEDEPNLLTDPNRRLSWMVYVLGGFYPSSHPIFTTVNNPDSPIYDDQQLVEWLMGKTATKARKEDVERSGGLHEITEDDKLLNERCPICLVDYEVEDTCRRLQCSHIFHKDCVDEWLITSHNSCPLCRKEGITRSATA